MLPPPMQDSLPVGWLAFAGRELNPMDCDERFPSCYILFPLSWIYPDATKEELAVVYMAATPGDIRTYYRTLVRNLVLQSIAD